MAKYFIPNPRINSDPAKKIPRELWAVLDEAIPTDAIVCVGLNINKRDVDIAIFTQNKVHVIESKNHTKYQVTFVPNQGLCEIKNGTIEPINNTRLRNGVCEIENAVKQTEKEMGAINYSLRMLGYSCDLYPYISIPFPVEGSDVSKAGIFVWIKLGIENLIKAIQERESIPNRPTRDDKSGNYPALTSFPPHSEAERMEIIINDFRMEQTTLEHVIAISKPGIYLSQSTSDIQRRNTQFSWPRGVQLTHFEKQRPLVKIGMVLFFAGILAFIISGLLFPFQSLHFSNYFMLIGVTGFVFILIGSSINTNNVKSTKKPIGRKEILQKSTPIGIAEDPQNSLSSEINNLPPPLTKNQSTKTSPKMRPLFRYPLIIVGAVSIILLTIILSNLDSQQGCSTVNGLRVRNEPAGSEVGFLEKGMCVTVNSISSDGDWLKISSGKFSGNWISADYLDGVEIEKLKVIH